MKDITEDDTFISSFEDVYPTQWNPKKLEIRKRIKYFIMVVCLDIQHHFVNSSISIATPLYRKHGIIPFVIMTTLIVSTIIIIPLIIANIYAEIIPAKNVFIGWIVFLYIILTMSQIIINIKRYFKNFWERYRWKEKTNEPTPLSKYYQEKENEKSKDE